MGVKSSRLLVETKLRFVATGAWTPSCCPASALGDLRAAAHSLAVAKEYWAALPLPLPTVNTWIPGQAEV